jgi:2-polyprenyl-3-methyl-5-hydroxy-6-metoxy-1,4-benzoquinol methylase
MPLCPVRQYESPDQNLSNEERIRFIVMETVEYDAFPYPAISFAHTNPERMATMAAYSGVTAAQPDKCRVLELGCANGTNLLSHAYCFPNSEFLGIDISSRQIEDANKAAESLRLRNTTFRKCDILELNSSELGTFDFIVAHGVYTWVPTSVRKRILSCTNYFGVGKRDDALLQHLPGRG